MTKQIYEVSIYYNGRQEWRQNGQLHRLDGPAIIDADGSQIWYQNGLIHRDNGPAVIYDDGYQEWRQNGVRHRLDGPAVIWPNGRQAWYIDGIVHTESEFNDRINPVKELTVAQVEELLGYRVKIVK